MSFEGGTVAVIGAGAAGLITAKVLLDDGFDVQVYTRDDSVGGVWSKERVYPGLHLNNVHGEFEYSCLSMAPPENSESTGARLSGEDMTRYFETFANRFLKDRIRFNAEVLNISRGSDDRWRIEFKDLPNGSDETRKVFYDKVVVCTGGCSLPSIPPSLSITAANKVNFKGLVLHSQNFRSNLDAILSQVKPLDSENPGSVVIIGGGKSAHDMSAYLRNQNRKVSVVFEVMDSFLATPKPLPAFIRKSRFLGLLSPYRTLNTILEYFFHKTWIGSFLVHKFWTNVAADSLNVYKFSQDSLIRKAIHSAFWGIRLSDEGVYRPDGFHAHAATGNIDIVCPARADTFSEDGKGIILKDGRKLPADVVILCTGYASSWNPLFDQSTREELGLLQQPPERQLYSSEFDYYSLANPPNVSAENRGLASAIYRGVVPAKNLFRRDFAVNGAVFSVNNGYLWEVTSHWISSYFMGDKFLKLPSSTEAAYVETQKVAAWLRKRYPGILSWANESYSSDIVFFTWPQMADELLNDMNLPGRRSGGNWLTWPFKIIDIKEIELLHVERAAKRAKISAHDKLD